MRMFPLNPLNRVARAIIRVIIYVVMWIGAVVLAVVVRQVVTEATPWWTNAVYYRILVDSFKDGDGDGLGDLIGLSKQISYVRAIGADAVILSPLSLRSTDCSKPGIVGFGEIDPRYGDDAAFKAVLDKAKKIELKVIVNLPLQTVSTDSDWFKSSAEKMSGFEDRILWRDGTPDDIPQVEHGLHAWVWHEGRNAFYASSNNQAILNLCSFSVVADLATAQCSWLKRGVSGVLISPDYPRDQMCAEELFRKMFVEAISCARAANIDTPAILVESALKPEIAARYYSAGGVGANSILSSALTSSSRPSAAELGLAIHEVLLNTPSYAAPTWSTSWRNESRIASRYGSDLVDAINLLTLILPGAAVIQQGDEMGVADSILEWASTSSTKCWPSELIPSAAPFPWDDTLNAGFTSGEPWVPVAPNYRYANAKTEFTNDHSHIGVMRVAAAMRKSPAIGPHTEISRLGDALAVLRWGGAGSLLVVSNLAQDRTEAQLTRMYGLPAQMTVASASAASSFSVGSHVGVDKPIKLLPGETVLLVGPPRHCGGPGPVDKIANKLQEGWQKINKYFNDLQN
ncbi:maltase A3-like isoform X2 [Plodia interpunctella]|uniref:maltase A3-like isoform X2 n=1 Tax=Plodia interpunctella TaxID=58824 RepID=UPI0023689F38|nr:maltase A3-like isoform X2 [Plodia interpunctella]